MPALNHEPTSNRLAADIGSDVQLALSAAGRQRERRSKPSCAATTGCCSAPHAASSRTTPKRRTSCRRPTCAPSPTCRRTGAIRRWPPGWRASPSTSRSHRSARKAAWSSSRTAARPTNRPNHRSTPCLSIQQHTTTPTRWPSAAKCGPCCRHAIEDLPVIYRSVFMLRAVEELSVEETALHLGVTQDVVKTRFLRARAMLRERCRTGRELRAGNLRLCRRPLRRGPGPCHGRTRSPGTGAAALDHALITFLSHVNPGRTS